MKQISKKILPLFILLTLFLNFDKVKAATGQPTQYINTVFAVNLCSPGSSLTQCLDPVIIGTNSDGDSMDLSSITAGEAAGSMGNLGAAKFGTTYKFAQVVLSRAFRLTGKVGNCVTKASTDFDISSPSVVGGANSGAAVSQLVGIPSGNTIGSNMIGTTSTDGINGTDNSSGNANIADGEPRVKFRFELATPFTPSVGALPTFSIAFDLSNAIGFSSNCTSSVTPEPPVVTASFN